MYLMEEVSSKRAGSFLHARRVQFLVFAALMNNRKTSPLDPTLRRLLAWPSVQVRLDLDTRCNLRCDFCSTGHSGNADRGSYPLDELEPMLAALGQDAWSVYLSCAGEPLLHPQFAQAMRLVRQHLRDCDVQMVTNATLLDEARARALLDGGLSRVTFSIDSVRAEHYDSIRVNARWETTRRNIERFLELRGSRRWPKVMVNAILMEENQEEIEEIADFCVERGIDAFRVQHLQEFADVPTTHQPLADSPALRRRLLKLQKKLFFKGVVFDHPYGLRWEKALSMLLSLRLHRDPVGYVKYLVGGAVGAIFSSCRFVGWEGVAFRSGAFHSCTEQGDRRWNSQSEGLLEYLRASRRRQKDVAFDNCRECRFHRPRK